MIDYLLPATIGGLIGIIFGQYATIRSLRRYLDEAHQIVTATQNIAKDVMKRDLKLLQAMKEVSEGAKADDVWLQTR